jgi:hypothetical protein
VTLPTASPTMNSVQEEHARACRRFGAVVLGQRGVPAERAGDPGRSITDAGTANVQHAVEDDPRHDEEDQAERRP